MSHDAEYGRVLKSALDLMEGGKPWPKRQAFRDWVREHRPDCIGTRTKNLSALAKGDVVPWALVEALEGYLRAKGRPVPVPFAERVGAADLELSPEPGGDLWLTGNVWAPLIGRIVRKVVPHPHSFCDHAERDLRPLVEMIYDCLPGHNGEDPVGEAARAYSARWIGIDAGAFYEWLRPLVQRANEIAMYAVAGNRTGGPLYRFACSVIVPVTPDAYDRMRAGRINLYELTVADVAPGSDRLVVGAAAERPDHEVRSRSVATQAHIATGVYQMAALAGPLAEGGSPHLLTFAGSRENTRRLTRAGFQQLGAVLPHGQLPLYEFRPHQRKRFEHWVQYETLHFLIKAMQQLLAVPDE